MNKSESEQEAQRIQAQFERRDRATVEHKAVQSYFDECRKRSRQYLLGNRLSADSKLMDLGCGTGDWLSAFQESGVPESNLYGVDLSAGRIAQARLRLPQAHLSCAAGNNLDHEPQSFDGVVLSLVLSSIQNEEMRRNLVDEAWRLLMPGGWLLVHEIRWARSHGDAVAMPLQSVCAMLGDRPKQSQCQSLILVPPLARFFGPRATWVVQALERIPILRGHWMARFDKEHK